MERDRKPFSIRWKLVPAVLKCGSQSFVRKWRHLLALWACSASKVKWKLLTWLAVNYQVPVYLDNFLYIVSIYLTVKSFPVRFPQAVNFASIPSSFGSTQFWECARMSVFRVLEVFNTIFRGCFSRKILVGFPLSSASSIGRIIWVLGLNRYVLMYTFHTNFLAFHPIFIFAFFRVFFLSKTTVKFLSNFTYRRFWKEVLDDCNWTFSLRRGWLCKASSINVLHECKHVLFHTFMIYMRIVWILIWNLRNFHMRLSSKLFSSKTACPIATIQISFQNLPSGKSRRRQLSRIIEYPRRCRKALDDTCFEKCPGF